jgi:hypothetical protein
VCVPLPVTSMSPLMSPVLVLPVWRCDRSASSSSSDGEP